MIQHVAILLYVKKSGVSYIYSTRPITSELDCGFGNSLGQIPWNESQPPGCLWSKFKIMSS